MSDQTLLLDDIKNAVTELNLLEPFDETRLRGASYDFAAGRTIVIINPRSEGGITPIDLEVKGECAIPPGRATIVQSLESVNMPLNMKGRLSLRSRLASKLWFFAGGPIDPGYKGYLFLPLANLSDVPLVLKYGEPLVSGEFIRLQRETKAYPDTEDTPYTSIPADRLPEPPPEVVYNVTILTTLVIQLQTQAEQLQEALESLEPEVKATSRVVDWVLLAAIGGILGGVVAGGVLAILLAIFS